MSISQTTGKRYSTEFKEEAIGMMIDGGQSMSEVAQQLGVTVHSLRAWKSKYKV